MKEAVPFDELIRRARDGDEAAMERLVLDHAPLVRVVARQILATERSSAFDSEDVSQSVFRTFCRRLCEGQYDLNSPAQLRALLKTISRNKAINKTRQESRAPFFESLNALVLESREPSAERCLVARESLNLVWAQLSSEERHLLELRLQGIGWDAIAQELGGTPQARRMQLQRVVARLEEWLGENDLSSE